MNTRELEYSCCSQIRLGPDRVVSRENSSQLAVRAVGPLFDGPYAHRGCPSHFFKAHPRDLQHEDDLALTLRQLVQRTEEFGVGDIGLPRLVEILRNARKGDFACKQPASSPVGIQRRVARDGEDPRQYRFTRAICVAGAKFASAPKARPAAATLRTAPTMALRIKVFSFMLLGSFD